MKKALIGIALATMFATSVVIGSVAISKKHKGKSNGGAKVNCVYCHKTAGVKKEKGQNHAALQKGPKCAVAGCHG